MAANPRIVPEIDEPALEVWETLQKRQLQLTLRKNLQVVEDQEEEQDQYASYQESRTSTTLSVRFLDLASCPCGVPTVEV